MHQTTTLLISQLFPSSIAVAVWDSASPLPQLFLAEEQAVERAVPQRRRQFAEGRGCARMALAKLGFGPVGSIPQGVDRSPVWPSEVVGSITHCPGLTACAAGRSASFRGIGLDAEPAVPLESELVETVCSEREREWISHQHPTPLCGWPKLFFCMKETVQKSVFPELRTLLEFSDVEVLPDPAGSHFQARAVWSAPRLSDLLSRFEGRFAVGPTHVLAGAHIPR